MSASYGIRISNPLPTVGQLQYDGDLDDLLLAIVDVLARRVTQDGFEITGPLDMAGNHLIDCDRLGFSPVPTAPTVGPCLYVNAAGDIHYVNASNVDVQISSGGTLAITVTGAIGGDYVAAGAHLNFVAASNRYTHTDSTLTPSALEGGSVRLVQPGGSNVASIISPTGLSGSYTLTMPGALPPNGGSALLRSDAGGRLNWTPSASFTEYVDVARGTAGSGTPTYSNVGWSAAAPADVDVGIDYQLGDRIDAVSFGGTSTAFTASILFRSDGGNFASIARCAFNGVAGLSTLQSGTPTMTGTLPIQTVGSGSYFLRVGGVSWSVSTVKVTRTKALVP